MFVKLTPEGGKIGEVARACFDKGIDSVGGTGNRLAIPDNNPNHKYLKNTPKAIAQGAHRFERGHHFFNAAKSKADALGMGF